MYLKYVINTTELIIRYFYKISTFGNYERYFTEFQPLRWWMYIQLYGGNCFFFLKKVQNYEIKEKIH